LFRVHHVDLREAILCRITRYRHPKMRFCFIPAMPILAQWKTYQICDNPAKIRAHFNYHCPTVPMKLVLAIESL